MCTIRPILFLVSFLIFVNLAHSSGTQFVHVTGHYSDADLSKGSGPTSLPRAYLYDAKDDLVPPEKWPSELAEVKEHIGDAYCCVSDTDKPSQGNEPPADCLKVVYGTDITKNFVGLMDATGRPIHIRDLPKRKWLLIEYAATWCAPCVIEGKALTTFFSTSKHASDYVWITVDVTRMIEAKAAVKAANNDPKTSEVL